MTKHSEAISNEDSNEVSELWKSKGEELANFVSTWVDYKDGMIVVIQP